MWALVLGQKLGREDLEPLPQFPGLQESPQGRTAEIAAGDLLGIPPATPPLYTPTRAHTHTHTQPSLPLGVGVGSGWSWELGWGAGGGVWMETAASSGSPPRAQLAGSRDAREG